MKIIPSSRFCILFLILFFIDFNQLNLKDQC